jgi:hypothetical protein
MLVALAIRDIVLIDRLDIDFASGMTVLTGETGAGKIRFHWRSAAAATARSSGMAQARAT